MFFKKKQEPVYIAITRALAEKLPEKVSQSEVKKCLEKKGIVCSDNVLRFALSHLGQTNDGDMRLLYPEYYFSLLDYEELVEARKNSREARCLSIVAIILSFLSLGFVLFGTSAVRLDESQKNDILFEIRSMSQLGE